MRVEMKLIGMVAIILIVFAFLGTSTSIIGKSKVCEKSEKGFWETINRIVNITSIDDMDTLILTKAKIEMHFNEVKILCDTVEEDINSTYKETKDAIQNQIDSLSNTVTP